MSKGPWKSMLNAAKINKHAMSLPLLAFEHLGSQVCIRVWYSGYDTVITPAPDQRYTTDCYKRQLRLKPYYSRARIDWYRSGRHLVIWRRGIYPMELTTLYGIPAVIIRGTNSVCIDKQQLNDWRTTNERLMGVTGTTGLFQGKPRGRPRTSKSPRTLRRHAARASAQREAVTVGPR